MSEQQPKKEKQVKIYNAIEKEFGFKTRVFSIQLLRPFYGLDVEKRYRNGLMPFNDSIHAMKKNKQDASEIVKERADFIKKFFAGEKERNPGMFTIDDMYFSFQHFSSLVASLYNKVCSRLFTSIVNHEQAGNINALINASINEPLVFKSGKMTKEYPISSLFLKAKSGISPFVAGLTGKIKSNFNPYIKEMLVGKKSIPNAKSGFPIAVYQHTSHGQIVSFQGVDYENEKLVTGDYVVTIRVPVVRPSEKKKPRKAKKSQENDEILPTTEKINFMDEISSIEFKDVPFIIHSRSLLRKARDGSANALIQDFITGRIQRRVRSYIEEHETEVSECIKSKDFKKGGELVDIGDVIEEGIQKWSGISSYEILARKTKFTGKDTWFVNFAYQALPKTATSRSEARVGGIDFCFSKQKILSIVVIDKDMHDLDASKIQSFVIDEMPILDSVYHLRKLYDKFKASLSNLQRSGRKSPKTSNSLSKIQRTFENKRKYFENKITKDAAVLFERLNVSEVHVENLDSLRWQDTWFAVNKIRSFPVKGMMDMLERKLKDRGIILKRVSPKNTSRTCPICGTVNDDFTFEYRSKNKFPIFTCKNEQCRYNKPAEKLGNMEMHFRDADLNASINIALKNE